MHKRTSVLVVFFAALFAGAASPGAAIHFANEGFPLEGEWHGTLVTGHGDLPVVFHIARNEDDTFKATLDSPAQQAFGIPMDSVEIKDHDVRIWSAALQGGFSATLDDEKADEITGTWEQAGNALPLVLTRQVVDS